ncbi:hypothetical protein [Salidesulfovibrio onnuriiensis]|uniref:hypothetical protein n=1 Tax=Salidesulfovibrio onnuriiensis TaxID=2583823 RepID=UPI00164F2088|nr:hypothetical protein [Salidesulfovibrio onnuriiensis]
MAVEIFLEAFDFARLIAQEAVDLVGPPAAPADQVAFEAAQLGDVLGGIEPALDAFQFQGPFRDLAFQSPAFLGHGGL